MHRCLVPFTSFAENETAAVGLRPTVWFAFDESRPLAFFAGMWATWTSVRKVKEGLVKADLFGFMTSEPNAEVIAIHPKAMPVILTDPAEWETWLSAPWSEAKVAAASAARRIAANFIPGSERGLRHSRNFGISARLSPHRGARHCSRAEVKPRSWLLPAGDSSQSRCRIREIKLQGNAEDMIGGCQTCI